MKYEHGISIIEKTGPEPARSISSTQIAVGTAPIHLLANPTEAVNKPIVAYSLDDVNQKLGYSENFEDFTLSEVVYASFYLQKVAPVVFINVLDPAVHNKAVVDTPLTLVKGSGLLDVDGVLLDSVIVKSTGVATTYAKDTDYTIGFNNAGKPVISALPGGAMNGVASATVSFTKLDPAAVTAEDIIGGYDSVSGQYSGMELVRQVFPQFGLLPSVLLAPGWSHIPSVAAILNVKTYKINGNFNAHAIIDLDSAAAGKYEEAPEWKDANNYADKRSTVVWPKVKVGQKIMWYSSILAATIARTDADNENVPSLSPSNKKIPIVATVLPDGTEVFLDQVQANYLNGHGIVTALNWSGWRTWGNNTSIYPASAVVNDRFISVRRMLDWWANTFLLTYFDKVDGNLSYRLIESIVDSENVRANGYVARGHMAGAVIEFRQDMNPTEDILNGKMTFVQKIGAFTPAEQIVNIVEYDTSMVYESLFGGEQG